MLLNIVFIIVGVALVLWGADRLTEGASALARKMSVPEIVIGLTIVAAGTSAPELFVSLVSALKGTPDMAVGNVVGSNIFNTLLIVGCAAMVSPMVIAKTTVKKDIPFTVIASLMLLIVCMDGWRSADIGGNVITRLDGIVLLAGFVLFMVYTFQVAMKKETDEAPASAEPVNVWKSLLFVVVGLACLIFGSNLFVDSATSVARQLNISEGVIGLTIVAGGTSLPELATSVVAARKGRSAIAIGNVIGSNVFNILLILGLTATITPMQLEGITVVDLSVMMGSILLLWGFCYTKYTVARWEGAVLSVAFLGYMGWLLANL
ncbi:MAG: calcium/sodium antiporter [Prevotella sp.]|nr:calcium/sodium antiporter [Prevotella sp.]